MKLPNYVYLTALVLVAGVTGSMFLATRPENPLSPRKEAASKQLVLRFGHDMPPKSVQHLSALRFADIVNYKTHGQVRIDIFPAQKLGTDQEMIAMARNGKLDIILPPTAKLVSLVPAMQVLDLPFLFPNRRERYDLLDGASGKALLAKLRPHGLVGISFWESGFKQFTANRPIRKPEDFKGLNIRVMKSPIIAEQFKAYGANPVPVDFHMTYQALKDGVVDGEENPLVSIVNMKFYEVQSHVTLSNNTLVPLTIWLRLCAAFTALSLFRFSILSMRKK